MKRTQSAALLVAGALLACSASLSDQADGAITATATLGSVVQVGTPATCPVDATMPKREMRGMWIASVWNIDWPSSTTLTPAAAQQELIGLFDLARSRGLNTVMLQVRPTADTFWPSTLEPWSQWLTGTQGRNPGWDPMAFAVAQAHARGLELHAWVNPYRVANDATGKNLVATHPAKVHPDWTISHAGRLMYNPGVPAARQHVVKVITELVSRYDVDAIHFDDYFYPYPVDGQVFDDQTTYKAYGGGKSLAAWRRDNITALIDDTRAAIRATRPATQFGVSPFAVWRNASSDPAGSNTRALQAYDDLFADTRLWVQQRKVDYLVPQVYWTRATPAAPYGTVVNWWADVANGATSSNVYAGETLEKVSATGTYGWNDPKELASHFGVVDQANAQRPQSLARGGAIQGHVFFSATDVRANPLDAMGVVQRSRYRRPALTPSMPWLDQTAPAVPTARRSGQTIRLTRTSDTQQFVVYKVNKLASRVTPCDLADARNVVAIVNGNAASWTSPSVNWRLNRSTWLVTAVDRGSNESAARVVR